MDLFYLQLNFGLQVLKFLRVRARVSTCRNQNRVSSGLCDSKSWGASGQPPVRGEISDAKPQYLLSATCVVYTLDTISPGAEVVTNGMRVSSSVQTPGPASLRADLP